ncbi:hypothetical protein [Geopseudomonas aromaticivorans]
MTSTNSSLQGKYIAGDWGHLFPEDNSERGTRIVIDIESRKVLAVMVQRNRSLEDDYTQAWPEEFASVEDSLLNANAEVFDDPEDFGLEVVDELPEWVAVMPAPEDAARFVAAP